MENQEELNEMKRYSEMNIEEKGKVLSNTLKSKNMDKLKESLTEQDFEKSEELYKHAKPDEEIKDKIELEKEKTGVSEKISMPGLQQALINQMGSSFGQELKRIDNDDAVTRIINRVITVSQVDTNQISDGYHTFYELYEHRISLFIALAKSYKWSRTESRNRKVWRAEIYSGEVKSEDWFILGIGTEAGEQITYHLPMFMWEDCDFVDVLEKAVEFDGHTSTDVLLRLKDL
jgi:hypothetical protein